MKWIGAGLVILSGYLLSQYLVNPVREQIIILEEGELLFRILESEIRNRKIPLPELFLQLSRKTDSIWGDFFLAFSQKLQNNTDVEFAESFEQLLISYTSRFLTEEERQIFLNVGRNLLSDDLLYQRKTMEQLSVQLINCLEEKKKNFLNQKEVSRAICLSMSALIVIFLI